MPEEILLRPLTGNLQRGAGEPDIADPDAVVFHRHDANFPWRSHAVWIITQMIRWGQAREPFDILALADRVYRPDLYRAAVAELGIATPDSDYKEEGAERRRRRRRVVFRRRELRSARGDELPQGAPDPRRRRRPRGVRRTQRVSNFDADRLPYEIGRRMCALHNDCAETRPAARLGSSRNALKYDRKYRCS